MTSQLEFLPNELFLYGIFPYLSLIDLNYSFSILNERFTTLVSSFLGKRIHSIDLTVDIPIHQMSYVIDHVLPYLSLNHQLKSLEVNDAEIFLKFVSNIPRINTNHLTKINVRSFIDIRFDSMMKFFSQCHQLNEIQLKLLTNFDSSLANGRKWVRWFDKMLETNREDILKSVDICVWCVDSTGPIHFDSRLWNRDGVYQSNINWKVRLQPDQGINWQKSRRIVEFSRTDHDYLTLSSKKPNPNCIIC